MARKRAHEAAAAAFFKKEEPDTVEATVTAIEPSREALPMPPPMLAAARPEAPEVAKGKREKLSARTVQMTDAQHTALKRAAFEKHLAEGTERQDYSAIVRALIDEWIAAGCPPK